MVSVLRGKRRRKHNPEGRMAVMDHLRELRRRLIAIVLLIAAGAAMWYWRGRATTPQIDSIAVIPCSAWTIRNPPHQHKSVVIVSHVIIET